MTLASPPMTDLTQSVCGQKKAHVGIGRIQHGDHLAAGRNNPAQLGNTIFDTSRSGRPDFQIIVHGLYPLDLGFGFAYGGPALRLWLPGRH